MNNRIFVVGDEYIYQGGSNPLTYVGESKHHGVGLFKSDWGDYHYGFKDMTPCTKPEPQYPNPPLPHCKERIAFAKGANIEVLSDGGGWQDVAFPSWKTCYQYRVKVEKTQDDLRIEELEKRIRGHESFIKKHRKELYKLKPTSHC
jgi:hypothetical protein